MMKPKLDSYNFLNYFLLNLPQNRSISSTLENYWKDYSKRGYDQLLTSENSLFFQIYL
jgi:hypothetical protein